MQNRLGVPSRMITPDEARELSPLINVDDVLAAAYSPDDGHATPEAVVHGYAAGARAAGASIETGCEVQSIDLRGDRIAGGGHQPRSGRDRRGGVRRGRVVGSDR